METEITIETEFSITQQAKDNYTVHGVAQQIIDMSPELASQRKHIEAVIKRLVHSEKYQVYSRIKHYMFDYKLNPTFMETVLTEKIETHERYLKACDDEVVTW